MRDFDDIDPNTSVEDITSGDELVISTAEVTL
jgi:hypothetical protein